MSKEVIAQYLADMEKDDFVFVHPTTTEGATVKEEVEAEAAEVDMAKVVTATSWADEVEEEEIMAAEEDAKPGSWAAVAAATAPQKPTGRFIRILHRKLNPEMVKIVCHRLREPALALAKKTKRPRV